MSKQAIGYTRLSQGSDTSIDRQRRHIEEYARENGYTLDKVYNDGEQSSGFSPDNLDEYQRVRARISEDEGLDALILNDKRRLVRDIDAVMRVIPDLRQRNVQLHTHQDGEIDLSDPMRAAIEILQAAAAFEEKLEEIEKSIEATEERLSNGYDHGQPPRGLQFDDAGEYWVPGDGFYTCLRAIALRDQGETLRAVESQTGIPKSSVSRIVDRRNKYEQHVIR